MKEKNNSDKSKLMKLLIVLNTLQRPNSFIPFNKTSNKSSTNANYKNKISNNLNFKENANRMITEYIPPITQVNIEDDSDFILPIEQVNIEDDSDFILPICDRLIMAKLLAILKLLQQSSYNEDINKIFKNISTNIKHKNNLSVQKNTKDKITTKYILPMQEVPNKDNSECIKKESEINTTTPDFIYDIHGSINTNPSINLVSTFPIIIAEKTIDIPIESTFRLKNAALDIKNMKKDVYLTNSKDRKSVV